MQRFIGISSKENICLFFDEIESLYSYILHYDLSKIIIEKNLQIIGDSLLEKYIKYIKDVRPHIDISFEQIKEKQNYGEKLIRYPNIETMFKGGELNSLYQPIFSFNEQQKPSILGFECLSRLCYRGYEYPAEVIFSYAQERLKIKEYDRTCLWQALRCKPKDIYTLLFINVRPPTLLDHAFIPWLMSVLRDLQLSPKNIVFEITEQHCVFSEQELAKKTQLLKDNGFFVAIDDFGFGMANFSLLLNLNPHYLKICKNLVLGIAECHRRQRIVKSIIEMANDLNIKVISEAVETKTDWDVLFSLNNRIAQGYYFAKPQPSFLSLKAAQ